MDREIYATVDGIELTEQAYYGACVDAANVPSMGTYCNPIFTVLVEHEQCNMLCQSLDYGAKGVVWSELMQPTDAEIDARLPERYFEDVYSELDADEFITLMV